MNWLPCQPTGKFRVPQKYKNVEFGILVIQQPYPKSLSYRYTITSMLCGAHGTRSRECLARRQKVGNSGTPPDQPPKPTQRTKWKQKETKDTDGFTQTAPPEQADSRGQHKGPIYQTDLDQLDRRTCNILPPQGHAGQQEADTQMNDN